MGLCFSCSKSKDRFKDKGQKICGQIQSAVSPLHGLHESNYYNRTNNINSGQLLLPKAPQQGGQISPCSAKSNMATSFTNMNITNPIKGFVSKNRNRYRKDGFDLDLTYITDKLIAMGYPASKIEGVYRNHIDDVAKFLDLKHKDRYSVYNLCSERCYDKTKFHNRVEIFPFDDHNPPKIEIIAPFCQSVMDWHSKDPENVAVVHCKAGKGRTGTMICCYLLHSGKCRTATEALNFYSEKRTQDRKGVTIPSQVRYVNYYEQLIRNNLVYKPVSMYIKDITLEPVPNYPPGTTIYFKIYTHSLNDNQSKEQCKMLFKYDPCDIKRGDTKLVMPMNACYVLTGDIKIEFCCAKSLKKTKKFHFWFNTFFVKEEAGNRNGCIENGTDCGDHNYGLTLRKNEIDVINKNDKQHKVYDPNFQVKVRLKKVPMNNTCPPKYVTDPPMNSTQETPSESEESENSDEDSVDDDEWDSVMDGETLLDPRGVGYRILSECEIASQLTSSSNEQSEMLAA